MKRLLSYITLLLISFSILAQDYSPEMMPNVNLKNRYEFVSDPANLMSDEAKAKVNRQLWDIRQKTTVEAVVAIPPSIGDATIEEWSEQLFTLWGIGKKDRDNGLLLVIAPEQRKARIQTGYGMEGVLPDIACKNIIGLEIIPAMREGNLDLAVEGAVGLIGEAVTDPAVAEELRSDLADNYSDSLNSLTGEELWSFVKIIAGVLFFVALIFFIYNLFRQRGLDNYQKAIRWRDQIPLYAGASLFSLGAALPFLLLDFLLYRFYRTRRRKCSTCGATMHRLGEAEDNELLSDSQDFEEQLDTVDYDVWECPSCGTVERYPFKKKQTKYSECPNCHTIAMCEVGNRTIRHATTRNKGLGERIFECKFCHNRKRTPYVIPKKESAAPLVAGAILGSMAGRGGHGGGGFGGGFGGGSTGGGGASGGW